MGEVVESWREKPQKMVTIINSIRYYYWHKCPRKQLDFIANNIWGRFHIAPEEAEEKRKNKYIHTQLLQCVFVEKQWNNGVTKKVKKNAKQTNFLRVQMSTHEIKPPKKNQKININK